MALERVTQFAHGLKKNTPNNMSLDVGRKTCNNLEVHVPNNNEQYAHFAILHLFGFQSF
jgi:hypothetical protein